jgi:hypothetical protein
MKIVQSFWSGNQKDISNTYGWASNKYNWVSWILSCHQLVKYHDQVELYTDSFGYEMLIEKLQLPYTKVHVVLDELNHYHKDLWAVAKIRTFQLQTTPFIHVDGDVFVWESLIDKFNNSNLVTQNLEITTNYYREKWSAIYPNLKFMPTEMQNFHHGKSNLACNMGIIGGVNLDFFKSFTEKSIDFLDKNNIEWSNYNALNFNIFFEQVLFYELANQTNQKIDFLFPDAPKDNEYRGFGDFYLVPNKTYLHLLGTYKRNPSVCKSMEVYTLKNYPESYSRLTKLINEVNENKIEIDFLTPRKVTDFLEEFLQDLKQNKLNPENYLLKRDLYNEGLTNKLDVFLEEKQNFAIVLDHGFDIKSIVKNNTEIKYLEIQEINCIPRIYELDEIDLLIIKELSTRIDYIEFVEKMKQFIDQDNLETDTAFLLLLNNRLRNYIIIKIISIYKE